MNARKALLFVATFFAAYLFFFPFQATAQAEQCGEEQICVNKDRAERFYDAATDMRCLQRQLEEGDLKINPEPYRVIVDEDGRVFAKDKMKLNIEWCEFDFDVLYKPEIEVHRKSEEEPTWGTRFRLRLGLAATLIPHGQDQSYIQPRSMVGPVLLFESFYWRFLHAEAHLGLRTFGAGIGVDLTKNLDLYSGAGLRWENPKQVTPILGLSLAFN